MGSLQAERGAANIVDPLLPTRTRKENMPELMVTKRNGQQEEFDHGKITKVVEWACEGLNVSPQKILSTATIQIEDGKPTSSIHKVLIGAASNLISPDHPDYQYAAGRLLIFEAYKTVWGGIDPPRFYDFIKDKVERNLYDERLIQKFNKHEIDELGHYIDHSRDMQLTFAAASQVLDKYVIQDRTTGDIFETPQIVFMATAMGMFMNEPSSYGQKNEYHLDRVENIKRFYDYISQFKINLPTPVIGGVRSTTNQYSSCVLVDIDDNMGSIFHSNTAIGLYIGQRAGIGINMGRIRAQGDPIRKGAVSHTGLVPFIKMLAATTRSCTQNGIRGGNSTIYYPFWHKDFESLIVLKNNQGKEETRERKADYNVQLNRLFYDRIKNDDIISLFSPVDAHGLYDAFISSNDEFERLYNYYEKETNIPRREIRGREMVDMIASERFETGMIYYSHIDYMNDHSPFKIPISMSNLCVSPETQILTDEGYVPIQDVEDQQVNVWNGEEWSEVTPVKTGDNEHLLKVILSDGSSVECTDYHKWYKVTRYSSGKLKPGEQMCRTHELQRGDELVKADCSLVKHGDKTHNLAWESGFYTGDGTERGRTKNKYPEIQLYKSSDKSELRNLFKNPNSVKESNVSTIIRYKPEDLFKKFEIPTSEYNVATRVNWLSGLADADGCVVGNSQGTLLINNVDPGFLNKIKLMLQELGVPSTVCKYSNSETTAYVKKTDPTYKEYPRNPLWALKIPQEGINTLISYGFSPERTHVKSKKLTRSNSTAFVKVEKIVDEWRFSPVFCFTEPKRNKGMFNGLLLGNCTETMLPTKPLQSWDDPEAEIATCILSCINLGKLEDPERELPDICRIVVRSLDNLIDSQNYPVKAAERFTKARRALSIGWNDVAHHLTRKGISYSSDEAAKEMNRVTEMLQYNLLKASMELAKERGPCPKFHETKYSDGILPIDHYTPAIDEIVGSELQCDWETLRQEIMEHGLRHSTLSGQPPCESSSVVSNSTNGIEPARELMTVKVSKKNHLPMLVPEPDKLNYELAFDMKNEGFIKMVGAMQKYMDQGISANLYYAPDDYEDGKVPMSALMKDMFQTRKYGWKSAYYVVTDDGNRGIESVGTEDQEKEKPQNCTTEIQDDGSECEVCSV